MTRRTVDAATDVESFAVFVRKFQPMLRNGLVAIVGPDLAGDAVSEALVYCWKHWGRVREMSSPGAYLWSVGRSKCRDLQRKQRRSDRVRSRMWPEPPSASPPLVEPGLTAALSRLSDRQRVAVFLIHGYGWTHSESARFLGVAVPTVQKHAERGLAKLQRALGAEQ